MTTWPRWDLSQEGARTERSQVAQREAETTATLERIHERLLLLEDSLSTRQHSAEQRISELQDRVNLLEERVDVQKVNERGVVKEAKQVKSEVSVKLDEMHHLLEELKRRGKVPFPGSSLDRESTSGSFASYDAPAHSKYSAHGESPSPANPASQAQPQREHRMLDEAIGKVDTPNKRSEAPAHSPLGSRFSFSSSKDTSRPERYLRKVVDQLEDAMIKRHSELEHKLGKRLKHIEQEVHQITEASHPKMMRKISPVIRTHHKNDDLSRGHVERENSKDTVTDI